MALLLLGYPKQNLGASAHSLHTVTHSVHSPAKWLSNLPLPSYPCLHPTSCAAPPVSSPLHTPSLLSWNMTPSVPFNGQTLFNSPRHLQNKEQPPCTSQIFIIKACPLSLPHVPSTSPKPETLYGGCIFLNVRCSCLHTWFLPRGTFSPFSPPPSSPAPPSAENHSAGLGAKVPMSSFLWMSFLSPFASRTTKGHLTLSSHSGRDVFPLAHNDTKF